MPVINRNLQADCRAIAANALDRIGIALAPSEVDNALYFTPQISAAESKPGRVT